MEKGSFDDNRLELWAPVVKTVDNKFLAVLSDDSIDRDDEIVGKEAMMKIKDDKTFVAALFDHENKIMNQVGEWVNRRIEMIDGHTTLLAEPKFYESNPNAQIIRGMLEEGAKMGVSIGAIVKDKEEREILGKTHTVFTELELLEASFVAIPANSHAHAMAVAKSYNKNKEVNNMTEETKKSEEAEVEEVKDEAVEEQAEADKMVDSGIVDALTKELDDLKESNATKEVAEKENKESLEKVNSKLEVTKNELEKLKGEALLKAKQEHVDELSDEQVKEASKKAFDSGELPVIRI